MRYVVIGAGAVGGAVGGRLTEAGREVVLVARGPHLEALRTRGLHLSEPGIDRTVAVDAAGSVDEVAWRPDDVAVFAMKSQDRAPVQATLTALAPGVAVVSLQNGVRNEPELKADFEQTYGICVMLPGEHLAPGEVVVHAAPVPGILDIGFFRSGVGELGEAISADLRAAGFDSRPDPAIMRWKYRKLVVNLLNAVEAVVAPDDPDRQELSDAVRAEGERVLADAGLDVATPEEDTARRAGLHFRPVDGRRREGGSSWQSLQRGTGSIEAEYLNGEIVRIAAAHGEGAPLNQALRDVALKLAATKGRPGSVPAATILKGEAGPR